MEKAPVTAATGALGPVIAKLAALLGSEYKLRWRTRRDVKFIRSKLKPVHSILWNIWEREELDVASKALKMEALDLADDVDDAIHDFILTLEGSRTNKRLEQTKIEASPFKDFKKRASDVSGRCRSRWKEKEKKPAGNDSIPAGKPRAYPFVRKDAAELVGIAEPRDELIRHLVGEEDETRPVELQLKKAFICGTAGMGKTTLADLVYEAIGNKFQSRAFVSLPRPGANMTEVLARILQQVTANGNVPVARTEEATKEEHLIDIISNFLKDKRYLVIIDDIWDWREWEIILKSLPENDLGSRIVTTTRIFSIANKWRYDPEDLYHEMRVLQGNGREWINETEINIATGMIGMKADLVGEGFDYNHPTVHMCGGTPLAVVCMLSAVAKEREKQGEHAKTCDVQDEIEKHVMEKGIQNTPGFEAMVESLQLCYDDLPHHMLKTCLLYCSIYPDSNNFEKDNLVRRWISEGFVYTEEEGNSYFEELLNRGLITHTITEMDESDKTSLRMHPMMRNFLRWKSRQDNFITCSSEITPFSRIRRLCICNNSPRRPRDATGDPLSALDWSHIRSLVVSDGIERVPFDKLEGVRVLDLCWTEGLLDQNLKDIFGLVRLSHLLGLIISEPPPPPEIVRLQCLETFEAAMLSPGLAGGFIGNLQQLKTLELRGQAITQVPKEIGALQQLHTLRIRVTNISELPKEIWELQQLKNLHISYTRITELPREIGKLQQLETLNISNTPIMVLPKEVGELQQLKTLNIGYTPITVLPNEIRELQQLKTLDIRNTHITVLPKVIGEVQHLEHLLMAGTKVDKLPKEIGALKELENLRLDGIIAAPTLPLEVCAMVELPKCIRQAVNKSGLLSELAGEMLSFQKSRYSLNGGLVVGSKQMHIPPWIREHFNDIIQLDIRICKLEEQGLKILREMPRLEVLTLRFEVVPREPVVISNQGFAMLTILIIDSRVPRVTFQEGAMPMLRDLTFWFQFYAGPPNKDPVGINHLTSLLWIDFKCNEEWYGGGDSPCIRPTIDVVKKEARKLHRARANRFLHFKVCGHREEIHLPPPSPPPPLEMEQQREMEQGETEEEEERSSGGGEIEEDIQA
ncbi:unnamed protein product [Alopecurus aequalis]